MSENADQEPSRDGRGSKVWEILDGPGDEAAACLGFAAGLVIDVLSHGFTVLALGSAATAGATAAVGLKKGIEATLSGRWFAKGGQQSMLGAARALLDEYRRARDRAIAGDARADALRDSSESLQYYIRLRESGALSEERFKPQYEEMLVNFIRLTAPTRPTDTAPALEEVRGKVPTI